MKQTLTLTLTLDVADVLKYTGPMALPPAFVGQPYSFTIAVTGGVKPYTFAASQLPPGLVLSPAGVLAGTPTAPGSFPISISVADAGA